MIYPPSSSRVILALGATDMRKSINALSILAEGALELDPFSGHFLYSVTGGERSSKFYTGIETGFAFGKKGWRSITSIGRAV